MKNMEIYGDNISNCILPSYLQEKTLRLVNMTFANTGNGILISDPLGIHIENIVVDASRVNEFLHSFQMQ